MKNKGLKIVIITIMAILIIAFMVIIAMVIYQNNETITVDTSSSSAKSVESLNESNSSDEAKVVLGNGNSSEDYVELEISKIQNDDELLALTDITNSENQEPEKFPDYEINVDENDIYASVGTIEIPATGVNLPILNRVTVEGMETAPCLLYTTGKLNVSGNTLIVGHNYRNGTLFSNNNNLQTGDKVYITSLNGNRVSYTIYDKFVTTAEDTSYLKRTVTGNPEISLQCCTDDDQMRIILLAKAD